MCSFVPIFSQKQRGARRSAFSFHSAVHSSEKFIFGLSARNGATASRFSEQLGQSVTRVRRVCVNSASRRARLFATHFLANTNNWRAPRSGSGESPPRSGWILAAAATVPGGHPTCRLRHRPTATGTTASGGLRRESPTSAMFNGVSARVLLRCDMVFLARTGAQPIFRQCARVRP